MADEIEIGSIVRLKSGGPNMTVEAIFSDHEGVWVRCSWSDDTKRISRTFDLDAVELLDVASYMSDRLSALPALPSTSSDQPDVILASSSTNLTVIQQATSTVPVVFVQVSDPHK